ncbi:GNAT family N-acetyltransferase [Gammaproteobacteria bacterium]|nr:GNAT family N-acetyltransferase [Gammaproteobacteria bacterium]
MSIETARLKLRQWLPSDKIPFARLNSNPEVMKFFPQTLSQTESDAFIQKVSASIAENGWGFWAVEIKATNEFIGFVGLNQPSADLPFNPCIEIGWRLAQEYWGNGYATEAAQAALNFAFKTLPLEEVLAFTPVSNQASKAVMHRINMTDTAQNFLHPSLPKGHALQEHVLFKITRSVWSSHLP